MSDNLLTIDLKQINKLAPDQEGYRLADDLLITHVTAGGDLGFLNYPLRVDAYIAVFCQNGALDVEINLFSYSLRKNMLLVCLPGNIIRVVKRYDDGPESGHFICSVISKEFLSDIRFDPTKIFDERLVLLSEPCFKLQDEEVSFILKYFDIVRSLISMDIESKEKAVASLISSLFYVMGDQIEKNLNLVHQSSEVSNSTQVRLKVLFDNFMRLVAENHTTERGMAFYASHLGLTPKYLSKLIKQYSGRPAPEWIDSYVILEAKNMLKYTGDSIKEIVYKLHFPNPSVFYKYFKSHTGMTPSEYRNA